MHLQDNLKLTILSIYSCIVLIIQILENDECEQFDKPGDLIIPYSN